MPVDSASRLDRMIARLTTQRRCLEHAAGLVRRLPGPVLEIGLGKGRTFSHLRLLLPGREIFAFDGSIHCPPDCVPDPEHLFIGDFRDTLAAAQPRLAGRAALAHADFGTEDPARDAALAEALGPLIDALMAPGGVVVSDREMAARRWSPVPAPAGRWPYFLWRCRAGR
jgi:hypothetical protein